MFLCSKMRSALRNRPFRFLGSLSQGAAWLTCLQVLEQQLSEAETSSQTQTSSLQSQLAQVEAERDTLAKLVESSTADSAASTQERDALSEKIASLTQDRESMSEKVDSLTQQLIQVTQQYDDMCSKLEESKQSQAVSTSLPSTLLTSHNPPPSSGIGGAGPELAGGVGWRSKPIPGHNFTAGDGQGDYAKHH